MFLASTDVTDQEQIKTAIAQMGDGFDILILSIPEWGGEADALRGKTIWDGIDESVLLDILSYNVNNVLQTVRAAIPFLRKGALKRIVLLTDPTASIRETDEETDYAYHMSQAAAGMIMKILFNTYRPEGFTFRCYADDGRRAGISACEYLLTEQSYIETDDYIHSDENRLVMRDGLLREISW
ncbi:MAG: hypothetical protein IJ833_10535 [Lachnospiraceae bacterium]|nr:hypothetical protein [Lachnospiraceae bacterium]